MRYHGIMATTHIDRHGERFAKEALEQMVEQFRESERPMWSYWNHMTTLPPIGVAIKEEVELREDGEYQLVAEIELLEEGDIEILPQSNTKGLDCAPEELEDILEDIEPASGYLEISYDPHNFEVNEVKPILQSLDALVETRAHLYVRKAELPPAVLWVLVAFAGGFIARLGELTADKTLELYRQLSEPFKSLLKKAKPKPTADIIFSIPIPGSSTIVEGAIEDAYATNLEEIWPRLPTLYAVAVSIIQRNNKDYFSEIKFLYNPANSKWEINYLTIRKTHKVILGPRYYDPSHPLRKRWDEERKTQKQAISSGEGLAASVGGNPN